MNKAELLGALRTEHDAMERAIEGLTAEQMAAPGAMSNGWSVKDTLAHIAAWEAEMVTGLYQLSHGRTPSIARAIDDVDNWNAARYAENAERPLDRILSDWRGVRQAMIERVNGWDEKNLLGALAWRPGLTLIDGIVANSCGHEAEHRVEVEAYRGRATA